MAMHERLCRIAARLLAGFAFAAFLVACAELPERRPVTASYARLDVADTALARIAAASAVGVPATYSGFRLLPEGGFAFDARLVLIRRAETSIDAQYYVVRNDATGRWFLRELRDAAARGVRVRLLVDDLYAAGEDDLFAGLAAHRNVEVRVFNPLPVRAGPFALRLLLSLHRFGRINHRMHNKLLLADASFAVVGGRNIADEYFMRGAEANFVDMDTVVSGAAVTALATVFDGYWNSEPAYPIEQLVPARQADAAAGRRFDDRVVGPNPDPGLLERDVLGHGRVAREFDGGRLAQVFAPAQVLADAPAKAAGLDGEALGPTVTDHVLGLFAAARESVDITSPYFIPGALGLAMMQRTIATGGRVGLVTNSIGATDEPLAYAGYIRYRFAMLQAGVAIHELSPSLSRSSGRLGDFGRSRGRLHAKVAVVDRRRVFIGSMNLDGRSARANTEVGVVVDSTEIARQLMGLFTDDLAAGAYRLRLSSDRERIEWVETGADGVETVHRDEPDDDLALRLRLWLLMPFVGEQLL